MAWNYSNNSVQTILSAGIDGVVTSISVGSITGFPVVYPYTLILDYGASNREVVNVTAGTGTTLTVTRGQDGTAAVAHSANAVVVHGVVARDLAEPQAHIPAVTNVHGLTGGAAVAGTTNAQTLQNKTVDNTNTVVLKDTQFTLQDDVDLTKQAQFQLSSIPTGTTRSYTLPATSVPLAGTTSTQTLTNKTLDNSNTATLRQDRLTLQNGVDATKQAVFDLAGITTATTRTYTMPDASGTLALTTRVGVRLRRVAAFGIPTGTSTLIGFDTMDEDTNTMWSSGLSGTVVIPFTGVYAVTTTLIAPVVASTRNFMVISPAAGTSTLPTGTPAGWRGNWPSGEDLATFSMTAEFNAGNSFTCGVFHSMGSTQNFTVWLQCFRVSQ